MSKNVFIALHTGCTNKGCEALITGAIMAAKKVLGEDVTIVSASESSGYDHKLFPEMEFLPFAYFSPENLTPEDLEEIGVPLRLKGVGTEGTGIVSDASVIEKTINAIQNCDYMIAIGGDMFSDDYGYNQLYLSNKYVELAKEFGKKVILLGHSIGKFRSERTKREAFAILEQVDLITLREADTYDYLKQEGMCMDNVHVTADLAFLMDITPQDRSSLNDMLTQDGLNIGIGVSDGIAKYCDGDESVYIGQMKQLTEDVLHRYPDSKVFYIPHVYNSPAMDDRKACKAVAQAVNSSRAVNIGGEDYPQYTAKNVKAFIAGLDAFMGTRTHTTIASWSTAVPTLAIAYSIKAHGITRSFFGGQYLDYLEDYRDTTYEAMRDKFFQIIDEREENRAYLLAKKEEIRENAMRNITLFQELAAK